MALVPYLCCRDAARAIDVYGRIFGALETMRMADPTDGRLGHAELAIGTHRLMLSDEYPDVGACAPDPAGGAAVTLYLQVEDVDDVTARAEAEGAQVTRAPSDQDFGERTATFIDPFGHRWIIAGPLAKPA